MNKVETFLSQELVQALGWTILHSLWQAALVALALSALLILLNRHSAQVRYFVSVTAMFTTLALAVFTFFSLYTQPTTETATLQEAGTFLAQNPTVFTSTAEPESNWFAKLPFSGFFETYFEKHLPLIVTFWFMGLLVMALKMLGSLAYIQRIKNYQTRLLGLKWQQKLTGLQEKLDFTRPVKLMESVRVKVPVAIGYLKPVILMPLGAINGLSEKQVEAILAHELAHIYRHDYIFNLVQTVIETIFFYHPAMWWIGVNVRAERENCCDDIALNLCGDSLAFAGALAELEEMTYVQSPALAMAYNGKNGSLLGRIKRMVSEPRRRASFSEGFIAACFLMVSISAISLNAMAQLTPDFEEFPYYIGSISAGKNEAKTEAKPEQDELLNAIVSTSKTENVEKAVAVNKAEVAKTIDLTSGEYSLSVSVSPDSDGKDIIIVKDRRGNIVEMFVDGKKVRKKDMPELERIIEGRSGKKEKKKKDYASKEDVRDAKKTLEEMTHSSPKPRVYVYSNPDPQPRYRYRYGTPAAPAVPPLAPSFVHVPAPPAPPALMQTMKPMKPLRPLKPMAPHAGDSEADTKEWEKEMKEWEKELKEWESNHGKEWEEFEKDMEEYGEEMEEYGKEMAEYSKNISKSFSGSAPRVYTIEGDDDRHHIIVDRDEKHAEAMEKAERARERARENAALIRERAARDREKAAIEREKRLEFAAKEREKAAREREKAAEVRAKEAKERTARMDKLTAELRKDKLIGENDKNFTYKISNDGLYVNNKKQPQATFEKYKSLFHQGLTPNSKYSEHYIINDDGEGNRSTIINNEGSNKTFDNKSGKAAAPKAEDKAKVKTKEKAAKSKTK